MRAESAWGKLYCEHARRTTAARGLRLLPSPALRFAADLVMPSRAALAGQFRHTLGMDDQRQWRRHRGADGRYQPAFLEIAEERPCWPGRLFRGPPGKVASNPISFGSTSAFPAASMSEQAPFARFPAGRRRASGQRPARLRVDHRCSRFRIRSRALESAPTVIRPSNSWAAPATGLRTSVSRST